MKRKSIMASLCAVALFSVAALSGCSAVPKDQTAGNGGTQQVKSDKPQIVNVYSDRHYDTDKKLYELFTKETGVKVNLVEGKSDELIERLAREGQDTEADLLVTADVGRLHRAKEQGLFQGVTSDTISKNVPDRLRDKDNEWFGLTKRARVLVYAKDRMNPSELTTYEDLTSEKWKGKVLVRPANIYNQSLLASFIAINGEEKAKEWAKGIVANMARDPEGNDRDQAKAVVAGQGDVAIMNTYYVGLMAHSSDAEEVKVAGKIGVFFPNQNTTGTHVNVSGIGVTKHAKNKENAIKLIEFLTGAEAQKEYAEANFEYPVNPSVEPSELLKSWGEFKEQDINLTQLGEFNKKAVEIFNEVGWK